MLDKDQIEEIATAFTEIVEELNLVGAQVSIDVDGQYTHLVEGRAHIPARTPMTADTIVQIGSVTKVHTAVLVMMLVDQGRLDLDGPVSAVLPDFRLLTSEYTDLVTPRHLMSMSSGLDNGPYLDLGDDAGSVKRYADLLTEIPSIHKPGAAFGYTNASTVVSGRIVETLTGLSWDTALRTMLLEPAGFAESDSMPEEQLYHPLSLGYEVTEDGPVIIHPWVHSRAQSPAGSTLATSAGDLARLGRIFLNGGVAGNGFRVLSEESVREMQTVQVEVPAKMFADAWGLGPYLRRWGGHRVFGHGGSSQSGISTVLWDLDSNAAIAMTCNTPSAGSKFTDDFFFQSAATVFGVELPVLDQAVSDSVPDAGQYVGTYERYHQRFDVRANGDRLFIKRTPQRHGVVDLGDPMESELTLVGQHRFVAKDREYNQGRGWDIAFVPGPDGTIELLEEGAFSSRRQR